MEDQPKEEEQKKVSDEPENKEEQNETNTTEEHKEEEHKEEEPNEEKNEIKENAVTEEEKNLEEEKEKEEQLRKEKEEQERKVFSRLMSSLKDHQKAINTIINKNYNLFPGADFTQSNALNMLKKGLEIEFGQLTTTLEIFKKTLIEQFKKHKDDVKSKEKDAYNQFVKIMSKYNDSKVVLEKNKNKYHQSVKVAELSLKNSKSMKVKNIDNSQESQVTIQKLETKATELLNEAKKNYDKYITSLKDANKNREEATDKEIKLLNLFQSYEERDCELITNILKEYYNRQKEQNEAQRNFLLEMDKAIKDIDLSKDNLALINANISEEKPDEVIPLVQYEPQIDFEKAPSPEEYKINHEIIKALKTSIPDIMPNFDIEKENQKQEMRELSKKIFVTNIPFTEEEKNKLMEYLQQKWSQTYFLIYLSKQRTNGRFARTQKLVNDLAEILNLILKSAHKEKDYHAAKNCMILSQTYYYDEKDKEGNTKKKYLLEFILNDSWLRSPEFWRGIIEEMINFEAKKYMELNPKEHSLFDTNNKSSVDKLSNICFSQLLPYTNNMKEFFIDDRLIVKIIDEYVEKYCIQKELADTIYAGVISEKPEEVEKLRKEYKDNPNFENELMTLEEVKKQKGVI